MTISTEELWSGAYKIPWDEPEFSRRMLAEHLAQDHELASRRLEWIERQIEWIHRILLDGRSAKILDLGSGPGLYSHRLAKLGHDCLGIDFGPASIEYARHNTPDASRCEFILGDIRSTSLAGPHDLALLLYGEFNVFPTHEAESILARTSTCLEGNGRLLIEMQTSAAVESIGRGEDTEQDFEAGLFSDRPHSYRTENQWLPEHNVAVQTFTITDRETGREEVYRNTTKAWHDEEFEAAVMSASFTKVEQRTDWPCNTDNLSLWIAEK